MNPLDNPDPADLGAWMRAVSKELGRLGRRNSSTMNAQITGDGGVVKPPIPYYDPPEIAVDAPSASPKIVSVKGNSTGLTIVTEPVLPTTLIDYYIDGALVAADQRTTVINLDSSDFAFALDTDYSVTTIGHNVAGYALESDPVVGRLDPGITADQVVGLIQAGGILTGFLQVGTSMRLDPSGGFTITMTDGRQTYMRADGTGNQFVGQAILDAIVVLGAFDIRGAGFLSGIMSMSTGINSPQDNVAVTSAGWDSVDQGGTNYGLQPRGLFDNGTNWVYTDSAFFAGNVNAIDKTTGARGLLANLPNNFNGVGGVVKVGASWYVLGLDGNRGGAWYVYIFNSAWAKTGEWAPVAGSGDNLTLGISGSGSLLIAKRTAGGNLYVSDYTTAGVESSFVLTTGGWAGAGLTGVVKVAVDTGAVRYVVASLSNGIRVYNTSSGARATTEEFPVADNGTVCGLSHDGTVFHHLAMADVWTYTNLKDPGDFTYTLNDVSSAGTYGLAETSAGPLVTVTPTKRSKWRISLPSAPHDYGSLDGANGASIYYGVHGSPMIRQAVLSAPPWNQVFSSFTAVGPTPPLTNGFSARPGALGELRSSGGIIDLFGDNSGQVGPLAWDDTGGPTADSSTFVTAATGWTLSNIEGRQWGKWTEITFQATRTGAAITNPTNGNIPNTPVAQLNLGWRPGTIRAGHSGGSGRLGHFDITTAGVVSLTALGGTTDYAVSEAISCYAAYMVA